MLKVFIHMWLACTLHVISILLPHMELALVARKQNHYI